MAVIGELEEIPKELTVQWKIIEFFSISEEVCISRFFSFTNECWYLRMYPNGNKRISGTNGCISVYLCRKSSISPIKLKFSLSVKATAKEKVSETHQTYIFRVAEEGCGVHKLISKLELLEKKSELMPSDILTILCTLKRPESQDDTSKFFVRCKNVCL